LLSRVRKLALRYGLSPRRAEQRTLRFVELLERYDCSPTLATPGRVVARNGAFVRDLQARGVEIAVHGFDHLDFRGLATGEVREQFVKAAAAFRSNGVAFAGFRCPYLSYDRVMAESIPERLVAYSSNEGIVWDVGRLDGDSATFATLTEFYGATASSRRPAVPRRIGQLVEIPVSLPDDLQILDGVGSGPDGLAEAWLSVLDQTHRRGDVFVVLTHPETADTCAGAFDRLLVNARSRTPSVWVARLDEVAAFWAERLTFTARSERDDIVLSVPPRATVLARGLDHVSGEPWDRGWRRLSVSTFALRGAPPPFIGLTDDVADGTAAVLHEEGYVIQRGPAATACGTILDGAVVAALETEVALLDHVDGLDAPLVRLWRWPDGARSALCVTGDLDALSLMDYASRVRAFSPF
jgi:peptidoglycan/xylan/chitin deacetylase (PgdA/CDA1 family)